MKRVTLRRGYAGNSSLKLALDDLKVGDGEDFVIMRAADLAEDVSLDGAARRGDIDTAKAAAKLNRESHAGIVLVYLWNFGASTCGEVAEDLSWPRDSVSPRIGALKRAGLVEDSGDRRGKQSVVRLTPAGIDKARSWGA